MHAPPRPPWLDNSATNVTGGRVGGGRGGRTSFKRSSREASLFKRSHV